MPDEIKKNYKSPRKSVILKSEKEYIVPDESAPRVIDDSVVCCNALGNLKRMPVKSFNMATRDFNDNSTMNEICSSIINCAGVDRFMVFTSLGNCVKIDLDALDDEKWKGKGVTLKSLYPAAVEGERIVYMLPLGEKLPKGNLLFYTGSGMVKKTEWKEYAVVKSVFQAIKMKDGDEVIGMETEREGCTLVFVTKSGMCLNADMSDIPVQGRISGGVKGVNLSDGDDCIFTRQIEDGGEIVLVTDKGYGKRVLTADLDVMARYRKGVKIIDIKGNNGKKLVFASYVTEPYKIVLKVGEDYLSAFSTEDLSSRTHAGRALVKGKVAVDKVFIYNSNYING